MVGFFQISPPDHTAAFIGRAAGVHNFTVGTLKAYFYLDEAKEVHWRHKYILAVKSPQGRWKTWVFNHEIETSLRDMEAVKAFQRAGPIYSQKPLDLPGQNKFEEVVYDLDAVFNQASYPDHKARHKRLIYPHRWLAEHDYAIIPMEPKHTAEIAVLHARWVAHKMSLPTTFKMMFPRKRYWRCCCKSLDDPERYPGFIAVDGNNNVVAARSLYAEEPEAYDLAQFTSFWDQPSNFSECFALATMHELRTRGISTLNCGASLNKSLSAFKHHWPAFTRTSWAYAQQKG